MLLAGFRVDDGMEGAERAHAVVDQDLRLEPRWSDSGKGGTGRVLGEDVWYRWRKDRLRVRTKVQSAHREFVSIESEEKQLTVSRPGP